jgi:hypothetical protein
MADVSTARVVFRVTPVRDDLSDKNTLVEKVAPGASLDSHPALSGATGPALQRGLIRWLRKGFGHWDPHGANVFSDQQPRAPQTLTLIDTTSCEEISRGTAKFFARVAMVTFLPWQGDAAYVKEVRRFLPPEIFAAHEETIRGNLKGISSLSRDLQFISISNVLSALPGYEPPPDLEMIFLGVGKNPLLSKFYFRNVPEYLGMMWEMAWW